MLDKKLPLGNPDNSVYYLDDMVQNATRPNRYIPFNTAEAYFGGDFSVKFPIRELGITRRNAHYYLAILQKDRSLRPKLKWFSIPRFWRDNGVSCGGPYRDDKIVRISVTQAVQQDEGVGMVTKSVPSFIWFEKLKEPDRSRAVLPEILESIIFLEAGAILKNREAEPFSLTGFNPNRAGNEQIQGRSGVVEDVPDDGTPSDRNRLMRIKDQMPHSVRMIHLDSESVRLTCDESVHLRVELCEVFLCPIHFGAWAEPWIDITNGHVRPT